MKLVDGQSFKIDDLTAEDEFLNIKNQEIIPDEESSKQNDQLEDSQTMEEDQMILASSKKRGEVNDTILSQLKHLNDQNPR